jgi:hypothetical protein
MRCVNDVNHAGHCNQGNYVNGGNHGNVDCIATCRSQGKGKGVIEWPTEPNREIINAPERVYIDPGDILQRQSSFD